MSKRERPVVYYGEDICEVRTGAGAACTNGAYWALPSGARVCGVHKRREEGAVALPKLPAADKAKADDAKYASMHARIEEAAAERRKVGAKGAVSVGKLFGRKNPPLLDGVLNVFPNFWHGGRRDGLGLPTLSPMALGPVGHGQPGAPPALNLENFHQGSKCYPDEVGPDGEPAPAFWASRNAMYTDATPHRHKLCGLGRDAKPAYFVWVASDHTIHKLGWVASRQFYCAFYERLASAKADLATLRLLVDQGTAVHILGYDGRPVEPTAAAIDAAYMSTEHPFGHELVLFAMLVLPEAAWPWRVHATLI